MPLLGAGRGDVVFGKGAQASGKKPKVKRRAGDEQIWWNPVVGDDVSLGTKLRIETQKFERAIRSPQDRNVPERFVYEGGRRGECAKFIGRTIAEMEYKKRNHGSLEGFEFAGDAVHDEHEDDSEGTKKKWSLRRTRTYRSPFQDHAGINTPEVYVWRNEARRAKKNSDKK